MFKNTLPTKLYWILFPIEDLRQAVEIAKRILTKEKIDRQLAGQSSSTPFMSIRDGHQRRVSFDTKEELGNKIDKLMVIIGKLVPRDSRTNRQFKPQIHQSRGRGQNRSYNQRKDRFGSHSRNRGNTDKIEVGPDMSKILGEVIIGETLEIMVDKTVEENIEIAIGMTVMTKAGTGLERGCFPEIMAIIELEVQGKVDPGQDPELA